MDSNNAGSWLGQLDSCTNFHDVQNPKSVMALTNSPPTSHLLSQGTNKKTTAIKLSDL